MKIFKKILCVYADGGVHKKMKTVGKLSVLLVVLVTFFSTFAVSVSADSQSVDGVDVWFETDKKAYSENEVVVGKFQIANTGVKELQDIDAKMIMPEGYAVNEGSVMSYSYASLGMGASVDGEITCIPNAKEHNYTGLYWTSGRVALLVGGIVGLLVLVLISVWYVYWKMRNEGTKSNTTSSAQTAGRAMSVLLAVGIGFGSLLCTAYRVGAEEEEETQPQRSGSSVILTETVKCEKLYIEVQFKVSFKESRNTVPQYQTAVRTASANAVYQGVIDELIDEFGQGEVVQDTSVSQPNRYCVRGLSIVKPLDFDNDGKNELFCVCGKNNKEDYYSEIRIYRQNGKLTEMIYSDTAICYGKDTTYYAEYLEDDNKEILFHTKTSHLNNVNDEWSKIANGKLQIAKTLKSEMQNSGVWVYTIDGNNVDAKRFETELNYFRRNKECWSMNNQEDISSLYKMLKETQKVVTDIAPNVVYVVNETVQPPAPTQPPTEKPTQPPTERPTQKPPAPQSTQPPVQQQTPAPATQPPVHNNNNSNNNNNNNNSSGGGITIITPNGSVSDDTVIMSGGNNSAPIYNNGGAPVYNNGGAYGYNAYGDMYGRGNNLYGGYGRVVKDWRSCYKEKLSQLSAENRNSCFELCDVDEDNIPELFVSQGNICYLYIWNGYSVERADFTSPYGVAYVDCSNGYIGLPSFDGGVSPTTIYKKSGSSVSRVIEYKIQESYPYPYFIIDNRTVSEYEYWNTVQPYEYIQWKDVGRSCRMNNTEINRVVDSWK